MVPVGMWAKASISPVSELAWATDTDINQLCEKYSPQARAGVTGQLRSKREWQLRDMGSLPPLWDRPRVLDYDDERAQLLRWI